MEHKSCIFADNDSRLAVAADNIHVFQRQLTAVVLHDGDVHFHLFIGISYNCQLALVHMDICVFLKSKFKKIKFRIVLCRIYLLDAVRTCFKVGLDDLPVEVVDIDAAVSEDEDFEVSEEDDEILREL